MILPKAQSPTTFCQLGLVTSNVIGSMTDPHEARKGEDESKRYVYVKVFEKTHILASPGVWRVQVVRSATAKQHIQTDFRSAQDSFGRGSLSQAPSSIIPEISVHGRQRTSFFVEYCRLYQVFGNMEVDFGLARVMTPYLLG
jgi:hypothetical protein